MNFVFRVYHLVDKNLVLQCFFQAAHNMIILFQLFLDFDAGMHFSRKTCTPEPKFKNFRMQRHGCDHGQCGTRRTAFFGDKLVLSGLVTAKSLLPGLVRAAKALTCPDSSDSALNLMVLDAFRTTTLTQNAALTDIIKLY